MSKLKIIFHCGMAKTGTTFLQNILSTNRSFLNENSIYYPGHGLAQHDISNKLYGNKAIDNINFYIHDAIKNKYSTIAFSSEYLYESDFNNLHFLNEFDLVFVLFIRNFIEHNESLINQMIKHPYVQMTPLESTIFFDPVYILKLHNNLKYNFPKAKILFLSYNQLKNDGIDKYFINKILNIDYKKIIKSDISPLIKNISLNTATIFFIAHLNCIPLTIKERFGFFHYFISNDVTLHKEIYLLLKKEKYAIFSKKYDKEINKIQELINDFHYLENSISFLENIDDCPYNNLPIKIQHEIYNNLPIEYKKTIHGGWYKSLNVSPENELLPQLPSTIYEIELLKNWSSRFYALEECLSPTIAK